jgi:DNA-binding NarL/FixJ family response regulator
MLFRARIDPTLSGVTIMADSSNGTDKIRVLLIGNILYFSDGIIAPNKIYLDKYKDEIESLEVKTGQEGISKAEIFNPHMVFIASNPFDDMDVIEIVHRLRAVKPFTKIITMSLANDPKWMFATIEAGADDCGCLPIPILKDDHDDFYTYIRNLYHGTQVTLRDEWIQRNGNKKSD